MPGALDRARGEVFKKQLVASLALPLFNAMTDDEVQTVITAVRGGWQ